MDSLKLPETNETPAINLESKAGSFLISGRSIIDDPTSFYKPIINWVKEYSLAPNSTTEFSFKFEYLNTESAKSILDILTVLENIPGAKVLWYFREEDEDMEEIGEELSELVRLPFELKLY